MHSLPIILHLEPDGSSEPPGDVEESFDDESPFFLWSPHGSVTLQTAAAQRLLFFLSETPQNRSPPPTKYTPTQRRASSGAQASAMRTGACRRKQGVFFPLLSPGLAGHMRSWRQLGAAESGSPPGHCKYLAGTSTQPGGSTAWPLVLGEAPWLKLYPDRSSHSYRVLLDIMAPVCPALSF